MAGKVNSYVAQVSGFRSCHLQLAIAGTVSHRRCFYVLFRLLMDRALATSMCFQSGFAPVHVHQQ